MEKRGAMQKFCPPCSAKADTARKVAWGKANRVKADPDVTAVRRAKQRSRTTETGRALNMQAKRGQIGWMADEVEPLTWLARTSVPFDYAHSKNAIYRNTGRGHVYMRKDARGHRAVLTEAVKGALRGRRVYNGRVWIDIFVQKPNHRGDAVNVVDTVCDAVKDAIGLDDNWFSIRRLDWEIAKEDPRLFVGIGQTIEEDCMVCSSCGREMALEHFGVRKHGYMGRSRNCKKCSRGDAVHNDADLKASR